MNKEIPKTMECCGKKPKREAKVEEMSDIQKEITLSPCPFCGGRAYIQQGKPYYDSLHGDRHDTWTIQCKHKDIKWMDSSDLPECSVKPKLNMNNKEEAIKAWNTRTDIPNDKKRKVTG